MRAISWRRQYLYDRSDDARPESAPGGNLPFPRAEFRSSRAAFNFKRQAASENLDGRPLGE